MNISRRQIEDVDLVKRIVGLAFALKDQRLSIRRKISFAAALSLEDQLADIREELGFVFTLRSVNTDLEQTEAYRKQSERDELKFHAVIIEPRCRPAQMTSNRTSS